MPCALGHVSGTPVHSGWTPAHLHGPPRPGAGRGGEGRLRSLGGSHLSPSSGLLPLPSRPGPPRPPVCPCPRCPPLVLPLGRLPGCGRHPSWEGHGGGKAVYPHGPGASPRAGPATARLRGCDPVSVDVGLWVSVAAVACPGVQSTPFPVL